MPAHVLTVELRDHRGHVRAMKRVLYRVLDPRDAAVVLEAKAAAELAQGAADLAAAGSELAREQDGCRT